MIVPHATEIELAGVPIRPNDMGITYGILSTKHKGVRSTATISFGENLKNRRNMIIYTTARTAANSMEIAYACARVSMAASTTVTLIGMKEQKSPSIRAKGNFAILVMKPNLELIVQNTIIANINLPKGTRYASYLLSIVSTFILISRNLVIIVFFLKVFFSAVMRQQFL